MAIVLFVSANYDGYGDLLFGLKLVSQLKKKLSRDDIYLVSHDRGVEKIRRYEGDREYNVQTFSVEEYTKLLSEPAYRLEYYIEGPVFDAMREDLLTVPPEIPVILVTEYSMVNKANEDLSNVDIAQEALADPARPSITTLHSGISSTEFGILIEEELLSLAKAKMQGDTSYQASCWERMPPNFKTKIPPSMTASKYFTTTDLSFEYSQDIEPPTLHKARNNCLHYLAVQMVAAAQSDKNQDVMCVGSNITAKQEALINLIPTLRKNGYQHIIFVNLDNGQETRYAGDPKGNKTYRLLYTAGMTHSQMLASMSLSGDVIGATGDQSLGEAISLRKMIVYEALPHKLALARKHVEELSRLSGNPKVKELAILLARATTPDEFAKLHTLLQDKMVVRAYHLAAMQLAERADLSRVVAHHLRRIPAKIVSADELDRELRIAINSNDSARFIELLQHPLLDLMITNKDGANIVTHACAARRIDIIQALIATATQKSWNIGPLLSAPDAQGQTASDYFEKHKLHLEHPNLYKKLQTASLSQAFIKIVTSYSILGKPEKRIQQLLVLQQWHQVLQELCDDSHVSVDTAKRALLGVLLLLRRSLNSEWTLRNGSLFKLIDAALRAHHLDPKNAISEKSCLKSLRDVVALYPKTLQDSHYFKEIFDKYTSATAIEAFGEVTSPSKLSTAQLQHYRQLLQKIPASAEHIIKVSRRDPLIQQAFLPFSVLKFPKQPGFYLLAHGEASGVGIGGWSRAKLAYYCNEQGVIQAEPIVIKIQKAKSLAEVRHEVLMFSKAHPSDKAFLYQCSQRAASGKVYSILPQLSGIPLDKYLAENPLLSPAQRHHINLAIMQEMARLIECGIAHCDIKAANMLYDPKSNKISLVDFGSAMPLSSAKSPSQIRFEHIDNAKFSIECMPPEYFSGCAVHEKLDVYSCAVVMANVLGISTKTFIMKKFQTALLVFDMSNPQEKEFRETLQRTFNLNSNLDETIFALPSKLRSNPKFVQFLRAFCQESEFDFAPIRASMGDAYAGLLRQMTTRMINRPSAATVAQQLRELVIAPDQAMQINQIFDKNDILRQYFLQQSSIKLPSDLTTKVIKDVVFLLSNVQWCSKLSFEDFVKNCNILGAGITTADAAARAVFDKIKSASLGLAAKPPEAATATSLLQQFEKLSPTTLDSLAQIEHFLKSNNQGYEDILASRPQNITEIVADLSKGYSLFNCFTTQLNQLKLAQQTLVAWQSQLSTLPAMEKTTVEHLYKSASQLLNDIEALQKNITVKMRHVKYFLIETIKRLPDIAKAQRLAEDELPLYQTVLALLEKFEKLALHDDSHGNEFLKDTHKSLQHLIEKFQEQATKPPSEIPATEQEITLTASSATTY